MQADLRRFSHRSYEKEHAQHLQGRQLHAEKIENGPFLSGDRGKDRVEMHGIEEKERAENAESKPEIANAIDDESLNRSRIRRGSVIPEADQEIGAEADALPSEEELDEIVGCHQHEHGEGEQA